MSSHVHELLLQDTVSLFNIRGVRGHRWHWHHCYVIEEERIQLYFLLLDAVECSRNDASRNQHFSYPKPKLEATLTSELNGE